MVALQSRQQAFLCRCYIGGGSYYCSYSTLWGRQRRRESTSQSALTTVQLVGVTVRMEPVPSPSGKACAIVLLLCTAVLLPRL